MNNNKITSFLFYFDDIGLPSITAFIDSSLLALFSLIGRNKHNFIIITIIILLIIILISAANSRITHYTQYSKYISIYLSTYYLHIYEVTAWLQRHEKPKQVKRPSLSLWDNQPTGGLWRSPAVVAATVVTAWNRAADSSPSVLQKVRTVSRQVKGWTTSPYGWTEWWTDDCNLSRHVISKTEPRWSPQTVTEFFALLVLVHMLDEQMTCCWGGHHHCSAKCSLYGVQMR